MAAFSADEVEGNSVKVLKTHLAEQIGVSRFRQRWLGDDQSELHDEVPVSSLNVQLVVLDFVPPQKERFYKLSSACVENHVEEVEELLQLPLNPDFSRWQRNRFSGDRLPRLDEIDYYKTPLQLAATAGHSECLTLLLEARADVNGSEPFFNGTALHCAAARGHSKVVEILIQSGAEENRSLCSGSGATGAEGLQFCEKHFGDHFGVEGKFTSFSGCTALHLAAANGHLDVVQLLLEASADKDKEADLGEKALHVAVANNQLAVVRLLLQHYSDKDKVAEGCATALPLASKRGHFDITCLLLERGKDPNKVTTSDKSALHFAAQKGHFRLVQLLVEAGANKEQEDIVGHTALHLAAREGHKEVVQILLEAGAHQTKMTKGGKTALDLAIEKGHVEVEQLLQKDHIVSWLTA